MTQHTPIDFEFLRRELIGADAPIETPFGERLMMYADYTASGRCLCFVENYLRQLQRIYANSHTEDDISGRSMTRLLREAEDSIKRSVNAGDSGRIICVGSGATGAIDKLQQLIGVSLPPVTRQLLGDLLGSALGADKVNDFKKYLRENQPVVFVGPYEHHSNEISWRENLATVIAVRLDPEGGIDLQHLEDLLQDPAFQGRKRIGSFSAASNVTGIKSPVHEIAALLHRYDAMACFDYAASAPYVQIDMNPADGLYAGDASLDAVFISPHKFLGGPGSSGVLIFNERIYRRDLPPTVSAGGTVDYVGTENQDFIHRIEEREKPGTPGVLQVLKAAMVFEVKDSVTVARIEEREHEILEKVFSRWLSNPGIEILGNQDPARRVGIVSFNIRTSNNKAGTMQYLHPKFVTTLLNDLFGIQSRAGCSCAGPYGHRLLDIDDETSEEYRACVTGGFSGIKPGWCRVSMHYVMDDLEVDYLLDAVDFVARYGALFLHLYEFNVYDGSWTSKKDPTNLQRFSLEAALDASAGAESPMPLEERKQRYTQYLDDALKLARQFEKRAVSADHVLEGKAGELQFFTLPECCMDAGNDKAPGGLAGKFKAIFSKA
ncbi:MAG: aminotransferase class V-fold PLP-dependent enzyme [Gammaproteobacteria bacterium]|nr:aminotransferase class V-fold PLP-dependent enzyme [Gammaproteobacteria bacterium]NNK98562.1 aminotransferase class V-fold PLP-dependent enzyme [Xanthomonadales bacterium]